MGVLLNMDPKYQLDIFEIAIRMRKSGLPDKFIVSAIKINEFGFSKLANHIGIPEPSIRRFLNSYSMNKRTLFLIYNALDFKNK